jgi:hypothetical protein
VLENAAVEFLRLPSPFAEVAQDKSGRLRMTGLLAWNSDSFLEVEGVVEEAGEEAAS